MSATTIYAKSSVRGVLQIHKQAHRWGFFIQMCWPVLTLHGSHVQKELQHGEPFEGASLTDDSLVLSL